MAGENLRIGNLFPPYEQYAAFLHGQPKHTFQIEPSTFQAYTNQVRIAHTANNRIVTKVYGWNSRHGEGVDIRLNNFHQEYTDPSGYQVHTCVNEGHLSNNLTIPTPSQEKVRGVHISSEASYFNSSDGWHQMQGVFIPLQEKYLEQLKSEGLVPEISKMRVWIRKLNTVTATIEDGGALSEDAFRRICNDIGLEFEFGTREGFTVGKVGNTLFELEHADPKLLSPDRIWNAMTGANGSDPFVFSSKVTRE